VKFSRDVGTNDFAKTSFIGSVNVFVDGGDDFEGIGFPFFFDLFIFPFPASHPFYEDGGIFISAMCFAPTAHISS